MSDSALRRRLEVQRRPAQAADIPLLRSLYADAHVELTVLPPDTRFVLIDMQFRAQRRQHAAQYPHAAHEILLLGSTEVGRVLVDHAGGDVHIIDISVALGHRREGIATAVLSSIVEAATAGGQRVWLTIWSGNTAARELCRRAGLVVGAEDDGYLVMERVPTH